MKITILLSICCIVFLACSKESGPDNSTGWQLKRITRTETWNSTPHILTTEYFYRPDGQIDSLSRGTSLRYKFIYNGSQLKRMARSGYSGYFEYEYDAQNRPDRVSYQVYNPATAEYEPSYAYNYTYDGNGKVVEMLFESITGNLTQKTIFAWQNDNIVTEYHYDSAGELELEYQYTYDTNPSPLPCNRQLLVIPGLLSKNNLTRWQVKDYIGTIDFLCYEYRVDYEYNSAGAPTKGKTDCTWSETYEYY